MGRKSRLNTDQRQRLNSIDQHVGSRVRMHRIMLGMSQMALGGALGLTFQQVQKYEKGMNRVSSSRLEQLSHILQVPITFFFEELPGAPKLDGGAPSAAYVNDFVASENGLQLAKAFTRIESGEVRRRIVALVDAIEPDEAE
jgi:transcriptional regulator with XRE-family HTH domain